MSSAAGSLSVDVCYFFLLMSVRRPDELEFLAPPLLAMAYRLGLDLTVRLYCTGQSGQQRCTAQLVWLYCTGHCRWVSCVGVLCITCTNVMHFSI
jgi:hypothetical protein